ncbi:MAG: hypothetical protein PHS14_08185 [Elusimicrobia bacterium]|nr:hypothetical protein [Elusimicrobiota bacterium]
MDLLQFGIDLGVIAGIIGLTQVVKGMDKAKKLEKFYVLIPVVLGLGAAVATTSPLTIAGAARNGIAYAGVAALAYMARKKLTVGGTPVIEEPAETAGPDGPAAGV